MMQHQYMNIEVMSCSCDLSRWREIFRTLHDLYRPFLCQSVLMKHESMFAFFVISRYWNFDIASLGDDVRFSKLKFCNHFCAIILTTDCDIFGLSQYTFVIHGRCFKKHHISDIGARPVLRVGQPPQLHAYPWFIYKLKMWKLGSIFGKIWQTGKQCIFRYSSCFRTYRTCLHNMHWQRINSVSSSWD